MLRELNESFKHLLMWDEKKGFGRLTSHRDLKEEYWEHYEQFEEAPATELLYKIRHKLCSDYAAGNDILDFGVGNGAFIKRKPDEVRVFGYDVDAQAVAWLLEEKLWFDPYILKAPGVVTFWDCLEHLPNLDEVLSLCPNFVICSLPVFEGREKVLGSKHFKPNEHIWYFSVEGFKEFMHERGFVCMMAKDLEGLAGREEIFSFVFKRV